MKPAERFPRFVILGELGSGTTGVVYEVKDVALNRRCAIKTAGPTPDSEQPARDRQILFESMALAYLTAFPQSSNIPTLHSVAPDITGRTFYCRELVDGQTLQASVVTGSIDLSAGMGVIVTVAGVLDWVHSQGFVHQNLNPENVLIARDSAPKLIGFGRVARRTGSLQGPAWSPKVPVSVDVQQLQELVLWLYASISRSVPTDIARITAAGSFATASAFGEELAIYRRTALS